MNKDLDNRSKALEEKLSIPKLTVENSEGVAMFDFCNH